MIRWKTQRDDQGRMFAWATGLKGGLSLYVGPPPLSSRDYADQGVTLPQCLVPHVDDRARQFGKSSYYWELAPDYGDDALAQGVADSFEQAKEAATAWAIEHDYVRSSHHLDDIPLPEDFARLLDWRSS